MTVQYFPPTAAGQSAAIAVAGPKNMVFDGSRFVVRTNGDYVAPIIAQDDVDATSAKAYPKLVAMMAMTPAQIQTWVTANVTNLAQAQDAIMTLATAVSILARRL